jgi:hypothetical protein
MPVGEFGMVGKQVVEHGENAVFGRGYKLEHINRRP